MIEECPATLAVRSHIEPARRATPIASFDVRLDRLSAGYAAAAMGAVTEGLLDAYVTNGVYWVSSGDLADLAGPGADATDPHGGHYIPPEAFA